MWRPLVLGLSSLALAGAAQPAAADGWHHGGHHHHGGDRVTLGFNFGAPVYPRYAPYPYYPPYYGPPVVVYQAPPPVVYGAPQAAYPAPAPQGGVSLGREVGQGCREYTAPVIVGGQAVQGYGIACPQPDGTWRIVQ